MGMEEEEGSAWQQGQREGDTGESEGRVRGAGSKQGKQRWSQRGGSQAFSNHFGTLGRRGCPGGYQEPGVLPAGPRPLPGQDSVAKG